MSGFHLGHSHTAYPVEFRRSSAGYVPLGKIPPAIKLLAIVGLVGGTAIMPLQYWWWHAGVVGLLLGVLLASRLSWRSILIRFLWVSPLVGGVAIAAALHGGSGVNGATIAVRGGLSLLIVLVMAATIPLALLPRVLHQFGVPSLLSTTMALMHRYLFVLISESERMRRARASRTIGSAAGGRWGERADLIGRLFVRASERAERIYMAMCSRGWK